MKAIAYVGVSLGLMLGSVLIYRVWPFRPIVPTWKQAEWGFTSEETKE